MCSRSRSAALVLALGCSACADAHAPACEPPPDAIAPSCAPRSADEWASGPADGSSVLVPESAWLGPTGRYADVVVLTGAPGSELAARRTFRLGLTDGTLTQVGYEALDGAWFDARVAELDRSGALASLLVCVPLPGGGELRVVPSRPAPDAPDPTAFYSPAFGRALRRLDATGVEVTHPLWASDESDRVGRMCGSRLVLTPAGPRVHCITLEDETECAWMCPGLTAESTWRCTGRGADGLAYCEPP